MDEGRARCPAVPAPGRLTATSTTGRPEAGPSDVIAASAVGGPGQRCWCAGRGAYAAGRTGPVKFIRRADVASHRFP